MSDDAQDSDDPPGTLRYEQRPRPIGMDVSWRLREDVFTVETARGIERIPYGAVTSVRLTWRPANVTAQGYRARLTLADGRTLTLGNLSWKSPVAVERQDAPYRAFMTALLARCGRANPALLCRSGQPGPVWLAGTVGGAAMTAIFAGAAVWAAWRGSWPVAALAALFLVTFAGQAWAMATRNRPGVFPPDRIPESVLPPGR